MLIVARPASAGAVIFVGLIFVMLFRNLAPAVVAQPFDRVLIGPMFGGAAMFAILLASLFSPMIDYVVTELNIRRRRLRLQEANHE